MFVSRNYVYSDTYTHANIYKYVYIKQLQKSLQLAVKDVYSSFSMVYI